jgi:hypothetical protein
MPTDLVAPSSADVGLFQNLFVQTQRVLQLSTTCLNKPQCLIEPRPDLTQPVPGSLPLPGLWDPSLPLGSRTASECSSIRLRWNFMPAMLPCLRFFRRLRYCHFYCTPDGENRRLLWTSSGCGRRGPPHGQWNGFCSARAQFAAFISDLWNRPGWSGCLYLHSFHFGGRRVVQGAQGCCAWPCDQRRLWDHCESWEINSKIHPPPN